MRVAARGRGGGTRRTVHFPHTTAEKHPPGHERRGERGRGKGAPLHPPYPPSSFLCSKVETAASFR